MTCETTTHAILHGRLAITQPARGHRAGTDAVLLAALARGLPGHTVLDFGAGVGTAGLALARREPERQMVLLEREADLCALARRNIADNGLAGQVQALEADVTAPKGMAAAGLSPHAADLVLMNPPWLSEGQARLSPLAQRRASHAMPPGMLAQWLKGARWALRPGGHVALIHRADALAEVLAALETGFGGLVLRPVQPRADAPAHRLLVTARLNSRAALTLLPALVLHQGEDRFTHQAEAIHRDLTPIVSS